MPRDWETRYREYLRSMVPSDYLGFIDEFMSFISELVAGWNREEGEVRVRHAHTLRMLLSDFGSDAGDRAKLNAFYAFLVFRGYTTAYRVLRDRLVAGGESIYTWLRLYRELMSH
ncbi:hypothetical protein JCM16161A_15930 [Vulcanisaeta sp. JCM 16161]|uniref:hypothetical protein n=1 Tax=Vulcanisaeta sp. JCM 16161 TaxID=1295372 RepID=UPI0006D179B8|nr:hypothetical protein [Vulcanisaeta sp. JCM 16161]